MSFAEFTQSLAKASAPAGLSPVLRALWHDGRQEWDLAHQAAQEVESREGYWVHAYLHRKEGDDGNAGYWYARAGRPMPASDLKAEWASITRELLALKPGSEAGP